MFKWIKNKLSKDDIKNEAIIMFRANFRRIINQDRRKNNLETERNDELLIADFVINEVLNATNIWLKGKDFLKICSRYEIAILGFITWQFTQTICCQLGMKEEERKELLSHCTQTWFEKIFSQNSNYSEQNLVEDLIKIKEAIYQRYTPENVVKTFVRTFHLCLGELEDGRKTYQGRDTLIEVLKQADSLNVKI